MAAFPAAGDITVSGRGAAGQNHYRLAVTPQGKLVICKSISNTVSVVQSSSDGLVKVGDTVAFTMIGSTLTGYVNGVQQIQATNGEVTTGTTWGFHLTSDIAFRIDDVTVFNK